MNKRAPIAIFAFNRPQALKRMVESLKKNALYEESDKYVFVDGARSHEERAKVEEVARIARGITENVVVAQKNCGLGPSIIAGVTKIVDQYGCVIVLEDDLYLAPGFLSYMNDALEKYAADKRIISVCGYGLKINRPQDYEGDAYLCNRSSSWGWGTWADRWSQVDWEVKDFEKLKADRKLQREFNAGGSDMYGMLRDYMEGRNRSWAIRFCYWQHRQRLYSVHPFESLVANEGYGEDATNCRQKYSRFKVQLDESGRQLVLPPHPDPQKRIIKQSVRYHSIPLRIYSRLRKLF